MANQIVVVGHGYWGKNIARNLFELGHLCGVCDVQPEALQKVASLYPGIRLYSDFEDVLADEAVDAVAISTHASSHATLAIRAMQRGKDAFVEKPLALHYDDALQMVKVAQATNRILMVGHLLEYHPAVLKLAELMERGEFGRLQYLYSNRLNLGRFRREENILWSFAPHDIAVALRLVGERPIEVLATGGAYLQPNVADTTVTSLLFDNGVRAHIFVSWLHPYKEQKLIVMGSQKMAVFDDSAPPGEKLILHDKGASWVNNIPVPRKGDGTPVAYQHDEPLRLEMSHFISCVRTRQQPRTDGWNGLRVLEVLQAAQHSLQTGGSRVPLWKPSPALSAI